MRIIKIMLATVGVFAVMMPAFVLLPSVTHAATGDISESLNCGANGEVPAPGETCAKNTDGDPKDKVQSMVNSIVSIFSWVVGIVSVIMIIFGGFRYITSGGDSGKVTSAKNTILFAIVGLVIVALAQIIVKFVIGTVGDVTTSDPAATQ